MKTRRTLVLDRASSPTASRSRIATRLTAFTILAVLLPGIGASEGAVKIFDCARIRACDGGGHCEAVSGRVSFRMEPVALDAGGGGRYTIRYGDRQAQMDAISEAGPYVWTIGKERDALLASSETEFLWHRLSLDGEPSATIEFLRCSVQF